MDWLEHRSWRYDNECELKELVGKVIKDVYLEISDGDHRVLIICEGGDAFEAYHMQDCCEDVRVHSVVGEISELIGKAVTSVGVRVDSGYGKEPDEGCEYPYGSQGDKDYYWESWTATQHGINGGESQAVIQWIGCSNGYYSENVYFGRAHQPLDIPKEELGDLKFPGIVTRKAK